MTREEFEQEFIPLFDVVKSWTKETAPQNVKDFPLFPESLFELLDTMESAQSEIEITDSTLTWKSNLLELLPKDQTGAGTTERLFGYLGSNGEMQYATFESVGNGTYTVPAPADAWAANSFPAMYFFWDSYMEGWNVHMQATCEISNQRIEQVPLRE